MVLPGRSAVWVAGSVAPGALTFRTALFGVAPMMKYKGCFAGRNVAGAKAPVRHFFPSQKEDTRPGSNDVPTWRMTFGIPVGPSVRATGARTPDAFFPEGAAFFALPPGHAVSARSRSTAGHARERRTALL